MRQMLIHMSFLLDLWTCNRRFLYPFWSKVSNWLWQSYLLLIHFGLALLLFLVFEESCL